MSDEDHVPTPVDANANLSEQLVTATALLSAEDQDRTADQVEQQARRLAELVVELNDWLGHGGTLPDQWRGSQPPPELAEGEATIADPDANPFG